MRIPLAGLLFVMAAAANAQTGRATLSPVSKLWIEGTSNVHDWKAEATVIDAEIELDTSTTNLLVKKVNITIPVKALKSGHGKMDENMQKALKADKNANIIYHMISIEVLAGQTKDAFTLRAAGTLTVAGAESPVTMDIAATRLADGTIKATATVPVKMTSFAVKPPTAMLGTIRCGDDVKVKFDLVVGPKVVAAVDR